MADGYSYQQQSAGFFYHSQETHQHRSWHVDRNRTPPNAVRSFFTAKNPSPSSSLDFQSPDNTPHKMFGQGQQQGRINGDRRGRGSPMMYTAQQYRNAQEQQFAQEDYSTHAANVPALGHHASHSSGALSGFTSNSLHNMHSATITDSQPRQINDHWADQLRLYKESQTAHSAMTDQHAPHYYARSKAGENQGKASTASSISSPSAPGEVRDRGPPSNLNGIIQRQDWHHLDLSGHGLRVLAPALFKYTFLSELYLASNRISHLPASIGQLRHLKHLDASNNLLDELPPELGMCGNLKNLLLFDNNIHTLPNQLGSLYRLDVLGIEGNPLEPHLKQEIVENGTRALIHHLREQAPVPLPPTPRPMLDLQEGGTPWPAEDRLRIVSYNILCDSKYVTTQYYGYTPSSALAWDFRREHILQEIQVQQADIVCLQEVSTDSFNEFFSPELSHSQYKGVFWPKTRAKMMSEKDSKVVDGCATFYNENKYILLDKQLVDFASIAINRPDMKNQHDIYNRVMPRDDIAVVTFFENRLSGTRLIIVNTHIFWNPAYADVKLVQVAILMEYVNKLAEKYTRWPPCKLEDKKFKVKMEEGSDSQGSTESTEEYSPSEEYRSRTDIPMLICSDLNSSPESNVYQFLSSGKLAAGDMELGDFQYGNFSREGVQHPFHLRSAHSIFNKTPDALTFTNYTPDFKGIIDYIWYSTNTLEVTSFLGSVDSEYVQRVPGFPNHHFPSDHLAQVAEFYPKGRRDKKNLPPHDVGSSKGNDLRDG